MVIVLKDTPLARNDPLGEPNYWRIGVPYWNYLKKGKLFSTEVPKFQRGAHDPFT